MPIYKHKETGKTVEVLKGTILPSVYELVKQPKKEAAPKAKPEEAKVEPEKATEEKQESKASEKAEKTKETKPAEADKSDKAEK